MAGKSAKGKSRKSGATRKAVVTGSTRADTLFPVGRLNRYIKQGRYADRVGKSAGAFMAAVLDYLTGEILELAGNICAEAGRKTIAPKHINVGIRHDEELAKLIINTTISQGG